jgi:hypothetical protein
MALGQQGAVEGTKKDDESFCSDSTVHSAQLLGMGSQVFAFVDHP